MVDIWPPSLQLQATQGHRHRKKKKYFFFFFFSSRLLFDIGVKPVVRGRHEQRPGGFDDTTSRRVVHAQRHDRCECVRNERAQRRGGGDAAWRAIPGGMQLSLIFRRRLLSAPWW